MKFQITDVGGQRSERTRWEKIKSEANVLIYVSALSDYNALCFEDDKTNRLVESMKVFDDTINSDVFKSSPVILIFNKEDIFNRLISKDPLKNYFDDYNGGDDSIKSLKYIETQFLNLNKFEKR